MGCVSNKKGKEWWVDGMAERGGYGVEAGGSEAPRPVPEAAVKTTA